MPNRLFLGAILFAAINVAGCSPAGPEMAEVEGVVLYKNKPMKGMYVQFMPELGPSSLAETDDQGKFKLQYRDAKLNVMKDGAAVGKHRVLVSDAERPQANQGEAVKPGRIPEIYSETSASPLVQDIKSGKQTIEVKLD